MAKVLIVEDEMLVGLELEAMLEDLGQDCLGIAAEAADVDALLDERPAVAFVDVNLRDGETGPQIAERLMALHGVTVVFITGNVAALAGRAVGALGAIEKPFSQADVAGALDFALARRQGRAASPPRRLRPIPEAHAA